MCLCLLCVAMIVAVCAFVHLTLDLMNDKNIKVNSTFTLSIILVGMVASERSRACASNGHFDWT